MARQNKTGSERQSLDTLKDYLSGATKKILDFDARVLKAGLPKSLPKAEMVDRLSDYILSHPGKLLDGLCTYELKLLDYMVEENDTNIAYGYPQDCQQSLAGMFLMRIIPTEQPDQTIFLIPGDLKDSLHGHIHPLIEKREESHDDVLEEAVMGVLNVYGILPAELATALSAPIASTDEDEIDDYLSRYFIYALNRVQVDLGDGDEDCLKSPFLDEGEIKPLFRALASREDLEGNIDMPDMDVRAWGIMPYPTQWQKCSREIETIMKDEGLPEGETAWILTEYWRESQKDVSPIQAVSKTLQRMDFNSLGNASDFMTTLMNFANAIPKWFLKGHSSDEIFKQRNKTGKAPMMHVPFSPNGVFSMSASRMVNEGNDTDDEDFEAMLYRGINPKTGKKIRPNDPCPCGSGLKYKKCHGRLPN